MISITLPVDRVAAGPHSKPIQSPVQPASVDTDHDPVVRRAAEMNEAQGGTPLLGAAFCALRAFARSPRARHGHGVHTAS